MFTVLNYIEYNLLYDAILSGIEAKLVGSRIVARAESLPLGTQTVTIHELKKLKEKALKGLYIIEHA